MAATQQAPPVRRHLAPRLAWALWAVSTAVAGLGVAFAVANRSLPDSADSSVLFAVGLLAIATTYTGTGALIASRQPTNAVGWILVAVGGFQALGGLSEYGRWALLIAAQPTPLAAEAVWLGNWIWIPSLVLLATFLPLLFPTGQLPSRRWRPIAAVAAATATLMALAQALAGWPLRGLPMLDPALDTDLGGFEAVFQAGSVVVGLCAVAALASVRARYRHAGDIERQQLKWVGFGAAVTVAGIVATFFDPFWTAPGLAVALTAFQALPVTIAVAMLRYRLYDIDRLLSRTVAYALLTGVLAGVYLAAVVALQALLRPIAGPSELAVAGATLAAAAVFAPARSRLQTTVDRRFNRARYDAVHTVAAFRGRVRDETSGDRIRHQLAHVTAAAVEPTAVAVWLPAPRDTP